MAPHRILSCLLPLFLGGEVAAAELPQPFNAKLSGRPYLIAKADIVLDLSRVGDHFKFTMRTTLKTPFLESELYDCSVIAIRDGRTYPLEHVHAEKAGSRYDAHTRFDWDAGTAVVRFGDGREKRVAGLAWPTWDPVSLNFQVMTELLNGRLGKRQVFRLLELAELSETTVLTEGDEPVETRFGEIPAVKVVRPHRRSITLWYSRNHRFIPVKIELRHGTASLVSNPGQAHSQAATAPTGTPRC